MPVDPQLKTGLLLALCLVLLFALLALLARWARGRSRGALMTGAFLSLFAPDPELEKSIRLAEQSRQEQHREDEEGEDN